MGMARGTTMARYHYRKWLLHCILCEWSGEQWHWAHKLEQAICPECQSGALPWDGKIGDAPGIMTDDIPGGILIKHGICNPDGSPKRYYSKTEIRKACNETGWTMNGDTPKPYKVRWSGTVKEEPRPEPMVTRAKPQ